MSSGPTSPTESIKSDASGTSTFKTIKKKIKNTFKGRAKPTPLDQIDQVLKRSNELEVELSKEVSSPNTSTESLDQKSSSLVLFQNEFKALKEALENMIQESRTLQEAVKTADSNCPDPFEAPETFSIYLAKRADSNLDYLTEDGDHAAELEALKAARAEDEMKLRREKEATSTALAQLDLLKGELDRVNRQNSAFVAQINTLKRNQSESKELDELKTLLAGKDTLISTLQAERTKLQQALHQKENSELEELKESKEALSAVQAELTELKSSEQQLRNEILDLKQSKATLEKALEDAKSQQQDTSAALEREKLLREAAEENVRLKLQLGEIQARVDELEKETEREAANSIAESMAEELDFKYTYLSNVIIRFLQHPEQRPELAKVLATTLELSVEDCRKIVI